MKEYFNKEIEELKTSLLKMASIVDLQVDKVFAAIEAGKIIDAHGLKAKDLEIDAYNELLQAKCENILALFQPLASDLRFVLSVLMINNQLERCGNIVLNISNRINKTVNSHYLILSSQIPEMGKHARHMISKSIDAFIHKDTEMAKLVFTNDVIVDRLNKKLFTFLVEKMQEHSELVEPCAHLLIMARNIERLADHAKNIAEDVMFQVDAKIGRNRKWIEPEDDFASMNVK
jgi:phosphate transport system protein